MLYNYLIIVIGIIIYMSEDKNVISKRLNNNN